MSQNIIPLPLTLNDANFIARLRSAAADSSRVVVMQHAKKRMRERKISLSQVVLCLQRGVIVEPAHLTLHGDWKATVAHRSAGDVIGVAVALQAKDSEDFCIVITVMI